MWHLSYMLAAAGSTHVEVGRQALNAHSQVPRLDANVQLLGTHALRDVDEDVDLAARGGEGEAGGGQQQAGRP